MTLLTNQEMAEAFRRWRDANPAPVSELEYVNPFTLLVAVVLSAQATDKGVNKATGPLFKVADTPQKMIALGEEGLISYIKTIGLYKNKAKQCRKKLSRNRSQCKSGDAEIKSFYEEKV